jgi:hypothetical protein
VKHSTYTMNVSARKTTAHQRNSSPGTAVGDVKSIVLDGATAAILVTCETTSARVTFDGSDPSAASAPSTVIQKDQNPVLIPIGQGATVKWCSTAAAASVLQIAELR